MITTVLLWLGYLVVFIVRKQNRLIGRGFATANLLLFLAALITLWPVDQSRQSGRGHVNLPPGPHAEPWRALAQK
jgi:uncharacterized membrane protein YqjE